MLRESIPVLHMTNSPATQTFYCELLGFSLDFAVPATDSTPDPCYMGISRDGATLHLSSHAGDGVTGGVVLFRCEDLDALHAEFIAREVPIHVAPVNQTWGTREMYVRDPDGNSLRFSGPISSATSY